MGNSHIETEGGAYIEGNVWAHNFIGRDLNIDLRGVENAAEASREILQALTSKNPESDLIRTDFLLLMKELRRTHKSLVKAISPLRRIDDDPKTFPDSFHGVYNDFRDLYDAKDFGEERTHCSMIREISWKLEQDQSDSGVLDPASWRELKNKLQMLYSMDTDVIEEMYVPFMNRFNMVMVEIDRLVRDGEVEKAITLKQVFLDELGPLYDGIKEKLKQMDDTIAAINRSLA